MRKDRMRVILLDAMESFVDLVCDRFEELETKSGLQTQTDGPFARQDDFHRLRETVFGDLMSITRRLTEFDDQMQVLSKLVRHEYPFAGSVEKEKRPAYAKASKKTSEELKEARNLSHSLKQAEN